MSTRSNIVFSNKRGEKVFLYHQCDGYPEGVGHQLRDLLNEAGEDFMDIIMLAFFIHLRNPTYELVSRISGDIEYLYEFNVNERRLRYKHYDISQQTILDDGEINGIEIMPSTSSSLAESLSRCWLQMEFPNQKEVEHWSNFIVSLHYSDNIRVKAFNEGFTEGVKFLKGWLQVQYSLRDKDGKITLC